MGRERTQKGRGKIGSVPSDSVFYRLKLCIYGSKLWCVHFFTQFSIWVLVFAAILPHNWVCFFFSSSLLEILRLL